MCARIEQKTSPIKRRILEFIDTLHSSKRKFYDVTGISRGTLEAKTGITEDILMKFITSFPNVSIEWLIMGRGTMFCSANTNSAVTLIPTPHQQPEEEIILTQLIPVYESTYSPTDHSLFSGNYNPNCYLALPNLPKCDGAIRMWGDTMAPELTGGDLLVYKKIRDVNTGLFLGQIYLLSVIIDDEEHFMVQYIEKSANKESIKLVSRNDRYPSREIPITSIKALAIIKANIKYRTL